MHLEPEQIRLGPAEVKEIHQIATGDDADAALGCVKTVLLRWIDTAFRRR